MFGSLCWSGSNYEHSGVVTGTFYPPVASSQDQQVLGGSMHFSTTSASIGRYPSGGPSGGGTPGGGASGGGTSGAHSTPAGTTQENGGYALSPANYGCNSPVMPAQDGYQG